MAKYKFLDLDPVANAKTLGILMIIWGVFRSLAAIFAPLLLVFSVLNIVTGIGLIKLKVWSLYILAAQAAYSVIINIYFAMQGEPFTIWDGVGIAFNVGLFLWFYRAKKRFHK